jgi:hypothetical protein
MRLSAPAFPAWQPFLARLGCGRRPAKTVAVLRHTTLSQLESSLAPALPEGLFTRRATAAHSRERVFTLGRTVWCWIWQILQGNAACREVVRQMQAVLAAQELELCAEDTGAYCQARQKIELGLLAQLFAASAQSAEAAAPADRRPLLQGRPLRVIDGTSAHLADTPANRLAFPPSSSLPAGTGFPVLRLSVLFSLQSGALVAQATSTLQINELQLLRQLQAHLPPGTILLGDRAYGQYVVAAMLQQGGVDLLSPVPTRNRKVDFGAAHTHLGPDDALFVWKKPARRSKLLTPEQWAELPAELTVRLLRVHLERPGFRSSSFVLMTTLLDADTYPAAEIMAAYARRWRLEMSLDDLKTTLGMESLHCKTPAMVQKELLVYLSAHNLIRWMIAQAATQEKVDPERISFKGSVDGLRQWSPALAHSGTTPARRRKLWRQLLRTLARDLLPVRPGRQEPRAVKKRSKHPHLNRPRAQFTARPDRNTRRRTATAKRKTTTN